MRTGAAASGGVIGDADGKVSGNDRGDGGEDVNAGTEVGDCGGTIVRRVGDAISVLAAAVTPGGAADVTGGSGVVGVLADPAASRSRPSGFASKPAAATGASRESPREACLVTMRQLVRP
jgi:hypothetical protein